MGECKIVTLKTFRQSNVPCIIHNYTDATATAVDGVHNPDYLMTQFLCIGNETQLTYCTSVSFIDSSTNLCNANQPQLVGGLICETGNGDVEMIDSSMFTH